jgi:hypothetical protein
VTSSNQHLNYYDTGNVPFKDFVIAVLDTPADAKAAADALEAGEFATGDIVLSAPLRPTTPESERKQGTLADPPKGAQSLLTEEGLDQEQYAVERQRAHIVIQVHTPHTEDVDRAHKILVAHQTHTIKRVDTWTRENLPHQ